MTYLLPQWTRVRYPEDIRPGAMFVVHNVYDERERVCKDMLITCLDFPSTYPLGYERVYVLTEQNGLCLYHVNAELVGRWRRVL